MQQPMVITARLGALLGTLGQMLLVSGVAPWGVLMFREDKRTRQSYTDPAQTPL